MIDQAILIRDKTRLEQLIERFNSRAQARFYIEKSGGNFDAYESEHQQFYASLDKVRNQLARKLRYKTLFREFLPSFIFSKNQLVLVIGQDGLVANTAKYIAGQPMIGINPDPSRYDGVLLNFSDRNFLIGVESVLDRGYSATEVTMAEARLRDGQRLLAFNDLFIGPSSHTSARYKLLHLGQSEIQSSSGIIVSTGAGSTGWLSSVFQMAYGVSKVMSSQPQSDGVNPHFTLPWDTDHLIFVVREPFVSRHSSAEITAGRIYGGSPLEIESRMPQQGIIFSDGIESDFIRFDSGKIASIGVADEKAVLVGNSG